MKHRCLRRWFFTRCSRDRLMNRRDLFRGSALLPAELDRPSRLARPGDGEPGAVLARVLALRGGAARDLAAQGELVIEPGVLHVGVDVVIAQGLAQDLQAAL